MNKRCLALTNEQYIEAINLLRDGFELDGVHIRANDRIATILVLEATLGLRLGDVLSLKLNSFIKDGNRWRLDIEEDKTEKKRRFTVPLEVYSFIQSYALSRGIGSEAKLFDISDRQVQRMLTKVFEKMELPVKRYGSHSFRKLFATRVYMENDYNIKLVQTLLQHASPITTQCYIGISEQMVENALAKTVNHLI